MPCYLSSWMDKLQPAVEREEEEEEKLEGISPRLNLL
jgi:hypothetical protein